MVGDSGCLDRGAGLVQSDKVAKAYLLAVDHNPRPVLLLVFSPSYSLDPRFAIRAFGGIVHVLLLVANAQVLQTVVRPIPVDVIKGRGPRAVVQEPDKVVVVVEPAQYPRSQVARFVGRA